MKTDHKELAESHRHLTLILGTLLLIGGLYAILLAAVVGPINGVWASDQGSKLLAIQSLIRSKYSSNALIDPSLSLDSSRSFTALVGQTYQYQGQRYSIYSLAFAWLTSVPFFFLGYPGLYIFQIAATLVALAVLYRIGRLLVSFPYALLMVLVGGITSPFLFYSIVFWEHTIATMFVTLALYGYIVGADSKKLMLATGLSLGVAVWFREESILCIVVFGLFALLIDRTGARWKRVVFLALGFLLPFITLLALNLGVYGTLLGAHVAVTGSVNYPNGTTLIGMLQSYLQWANILILPLNDRLLLVLMAVVVMLFLVSLLKRNPILRIPLEIIFSVCALIFGIYITVIQKNTLQTTLLVTFAPLLLCLLPKLRYADHIADSHQVHHQQRRTIRVLAWFAVGYLALAWFVRIPDGGAQWGPRMLLPIVPALIILGVWRLSQALGENKQQIVRTPLVFAASALILSSVVSAGYGVRQARESNINSIVISTAVAQSQQRVVITDIWYAPLVVAPIFYEGQLFFYVDSGERFDALLSLLQEEHVTSFYYLRYQEIDRIADSRLFSHITPLQDERLLPHNLRGRTYHITR